MRGWRGERTPVTFVAGTFCPPPAEPTARGRVFPLANQDPPLASEVFSWLEELGYRVERLPYPEWLDARRDAAHREEEDVVGGVLGGAPGWQEIWDGNTYDDRNTRSALRDSGPERPVINAALLERYARYFAEQGWVEAPPALTAERRSPA